AAARLPGRSARRIYRRAPPARIPHQKGVRPPLYGLLRPPDLGGGQLARSANPRWRSVGCVGFSGAGKRSRRARLDPGNSPATQSAVPVRNVLSESCKDDMISVDQPAAASHAKTII